MHEIFYYTTAIGGKVALRMKLNAVYRQSSMRKCHDDIILLLESSAD